MRNINEIYNQKYNEMEDEEILDLIHIGEIEAYEYLMYKYQRLVLSKTKTYFLIGADREDIIQEGMIGLFKAIRDFKKDKLSTFISFADLCITRQIITAIKTASRQKHLPLNTYISLDKPIYDTESNSTLMDTLTISKTLDPQEIVISKEEFKNIEVNVLGILSELERGVLFLYLDGQSYKEISGELNSHVKAIDNALTRIKRKLEKYFELRKLAMEN